jgi:hypothetical protein
VNLAQGEKGISSQGSAFNEFFLFKLHTRLWEHRTRTYIEIARPYKGIVLSQPNYVLALLNEISMFGCRTTASPVNQNNHQLCAQSGETVNKLIQRATNGCRPTHLFVSHKTGYIL